MALVVEDGTGKTDSESYISVADADSYFSKFGEPTDWTNASATDKEVALRNATRYIDLSVRFMGERVDDDQALEWPRKKFTDTRGRTVDKGTIPELLEQATAELAAHHLDTALGSESPIIKSESYGKASATYASAFRESAPSKVIIKSLSVYGNASSSIRMVYRAYVSH